MEKEYKVYYPTAIGWLELVGNDEAITDLNFIDDPGDSVREAAKPAELPAVMQACLTQLDEYFRKERHVFDLKLEPNGTAFQKSVWRELLEIPYGQTVSYLHIARQLGDEKAVRAVGAANGRNPISIIIPCHRVIGSGGQLTGYGGGLWRKEWLLNHESEPIGEQLKLF
jgi:methylated-DNA-[protein]-cysteine S-methyltransferase